MKMIKQFAEKQDRIPSPEDEPEYPYSGYWWKAVAYTLLLGRVRQKGQDALLSALFTSGWAYTFSHNKA